MELDRVCQLLAQLAPLRLAESWDNVGLLLGDRTQPVRRVMTCLTISPNVVDEAVEEGADLVVAHHPLPFHPVKKITGDTIVGSMLLKLIGNSVAVYSAHTAFDSAEAGINQRWAELMETGSIEPLIEADDDTPDDTPVGSGRSGRLVEPVPLERLVERAAAIVGANCPRRVGAADQTVEKIAFACGSGGSFLAAARRKGCDALITGEATFHTCLEAESSGIGLGLLGHYWSERFAMERLAEELVDPLPGLTVWASRRERDPIEPVPR